MTRHIAFAVVIALAGPLGSSRVSLSAQSTPSVIISEVHPSGSANGTYGADWFEVTNTGGVPVDITGWKMDDNSNALNTAVPLRGVASIPPGRSAVFFEGAANGATDAAIIAAFSNAWFGTATPPSGLLIGAYGGPGVGLGGGGDAVNLFDAGGLPITGVSFGAATANRTFDNAAGLAVVSALSTVGVNGGFLSFNGAETGSPGRRAAPPSLTNVDLSLYLRIGRFDLPEPTRTPAPPNSVLAQEVSAVTYNWDTNTLFVTGDGGTSIVQVSKTGQLIDSMTLAPGASPQGTDFYDPEGLTYVGGGKFVMVEERDRQAVLFTYAPGTTLTRAGAQTVKLGTFVPNIGIEGITYDPLTGGFIAVKETAPQGIFQTGIDFSAGTATNGSATTENSIDLFDPALANLLDFADVFALSNLTSLSGPESGHLLVLSQESGKIVNIDRNGSISSSLTILNDPGNPLSVPAQQHEGLTMDSDGYLYVVSENGGGDFDHPQLWVYAPSSVPNQAPTALALNNQLNTIAENTSTTVRIKVADVAIADDGLGTNNLTVTGPDAAFFDVDSNGLYIKAGTTLDFETKNSYSVTVEVDDTTVGGTPDATAQFALSLTDTAEQPPVVASLIISEVAPWSSGNSPVGADWFEVTNTGAAAVDLTGWKVDDSSESFVAAVPLTGIASIAPGESVIFIETADLATAKAAFINTWFGAHAPAGLQIGSYTGSGIGLSTGGDAVNLYNSTGVLHARVFFAASPAGPSFPTFDNAAGLNNAAISQLSVAGLHGAFVAVSDPNEIGSPGAIVAAHVVISEVSPWSSGNTPYAADWFEVTNAGAAPLDLSGWKTDDNSNAFASSVVLRGVPSIPAGKSAVFFEGLADGSTDAALIAAFSTAWFGTPTPPAGFLIGAYGGSGVGLSTGGDAVNLFDPAGTRITGVSFGPSTTGFTFDNKAGLGSGTLPLPTITTLSVAGVNGAFVAADAVEVGSPGTTVADTTPPIIALHANILVTAPEASGAVVTYTPPVAVDNVDRTVAVTCAPASGGRFPLGLTIVTCTASDAALNAAVPVTFTVTVNGAPLAEPDAASTLESTAITIPVLANDTDGDGDPLTLVSVGTPAHGSTAIGLGGVVYTPAADFYGVDTFEYQISDGRGGSAIGVVTVSVSRLGRFVALSRDLTRMRAGSTAVTGDVGAIERRQSGHGRDRDNDDGDRDDVTVRIDQGATMQQPTSRVVGDTVLLQKRSSVYAVIENVLLDRRDSTILGTITSPMTTPFVALPSFPTVQVGTQKISVAKNRTVTLGPGRYDEVRVAAGATLILTGGLYQVESIELDSSATILFRAATELRVRTELATEAKARVILDASVSGLTASQVVIYVAGRDEDGRRGKHGGDGDDSEQVTVDIGSENVVQANIYAARGTVSLKSKTRATGAFIGMHVRIGEDATLTLDSAFK